MGYYGRDWANVSTVNLIAEDELTFSTITPMDACKAWEYAFGLTAVNTWNAVYLPPIAARFDELIPGFNFTVRRASRLTSNSRAQTDPPLHIPQENNIHGMLYSCAYELAAYGCVFAIVAQLDFDGR